MDHHVEVDPPPLVRLPAAPSASTMILERLVATVTHNTNISVFIHVGGRVGRVLVVVVIVENW